MKKLILLIIIILLCWGGYTWYTHRAQTPTTEQKVEQTLDTAGDALQQAGDAVDSAVTDVENTVQN